MSSNGALMQKSVYDTDNDGKVNSAVAADTVPWTGVTGKPDAVQADWSESDSSASSYIRNKPVITPPEQADWDESSSTALSFIRNKPDLHDLNPQVQADWGESDSSELAYIRNKPAIPVVNNYTITITQGGVAKGSFTLNQGSNGTIPLDAGSGGGEISPITSVVAETLEAGEQATAAFSSGTLTLGIPRGSDGLDGSDGTDGITPAIHGGIATVVAYGLSPTVDVVSSAGNSYTFNFGIPAGSPGSNGSDGVTPVFSMASATTLDPGSAATANMTSAGSVYTISLGIPRGSDGTGGVGTVTWGGIQGTLSSQTDLYTALGSKQNTIDNSHKLDYGLLSNTPTIPTVNNATIVISQGGSSRGSFTLNQSANGSVVLDGVSWGGISGTLSGQADLWSELDKKMERINGIIAVSSVSQLPASPTSGVLYIIPES